MEHEISRASETVDGMYEACSRQWHYDKSGHKTRIGDMDIAWLRNVIRTKRGHYSIVPYEIVLARKVQDLNRAIAQRDAQEFDDATANGTFGDSYPQWQEQI